jgi:2-polyprenyl-3-methyl-5-hydroxy-6-metoxy-1,4-benzoquinol methylase
MSCPVCNASSVSDGIKLGDYAIERCSQCGLRFAPDAFDIQMDYDQVYESEDYIKTQVGPISSAEAQHAFTEHATYSPFFRHVEYTPGDTLLDVGCGVGRFLQGAHSTGWSVEGIDFSEKAVEIGRRYAKFPMRAGSLDDEIRSGKRFNVVTMFEVLEHLSQPVTFLEKCKMALERNGSIFCTVPNWECSVVQHSTNPAWIPPIHLLFFNESSLRALAAKAGLEVIETGFIGQNAFPAAMNSLWPLKVFKWLVKLILRRSREPLGIWMHARVAKRG